MKLDDQRTCAFLGPEPRQWLAVAGDHHGASAGGVVFLRGVDAEGLIAAGGYVVGGDGFRLRPGGGFIGFSNEPSAGSEW